jgi:hypothetical protein
MAKVKYFVLSLQVCSILPDKSPYYMICHLSNVLIRNSPVDGSTSLLQATIVLMDQVLYVVATRFCFEFDLLIITFGR